MDAFDAIKRRCSIREFNDEPIPKDVIGKIVDCGRLAPTARKEEPWEFIVIDDREILGGIASITDHGKFIRDCACAIIVCCRDTKYYLEDGCASTENMLIAATALGIGSCWVAGDKKDYCDKILNLLKVPAGYKLISIIALGRPIKDTDPLQKRPLEKVIHWNGF